MASILHLDLVADAGAIAVQFSSVTQSCPTLGNPMICSTPGLPLHYQLPEHTQTDVHWVSDAIQPSHPLSSPSPPALNLSQHQGLFQWVSSSHQVASFGVLASISESPLDCKEIQPVHPKGDQPWVFIGRTDVLFPLGNSNILNSSQMS